MQDRTHRTRARLIGAARALTRDGGIAALRTEAVARTAGVAKGTPFAHFADRDGLALALVGADLSAAADALHADGPDDLAARLGPTLRLIGGDRALFDLVQRHSGATGPLGAPALEDWFLGLMAGIETHVAARQAAGATRRDIRARLLAEGAFAFLMQTAMFRPCGVLPDDAAASARLRALLTAWLGPAARPAHGMARPGCAPCSRHGSARPRVLPAAWLGPATGRDATHQVAIRAPCVAPDRARLPAPRQRPAQMPCRPLTERPPQ
jgi:AcrR family transcriptional regulator